MTHGLFLHDPESTEPYTADWSDLDGATIQTSAWSISPSAGVTISGTSIGATSTSCSVAGLVDGRRYVLTNEVTWVGGAGPMQRSTEILAGQR